MHAIPTAACTRARVSEVEVESGTDKKKIITNANFSKQNKQDIK